MHEGDLKSAENKVQDMLRDDPQNASLFFVLGTILRRGEQFDEALDAFTQSLHLNPAFAETHSQLSYLYYRTDDSDYALDEARTALSMDPRNAEAYRYLGLALYADKNYDAALNAFEKSLEREPENADVYFDIGIAQRDHGDLRRAATAYHHALTLRPDFWQAHSNLGVVLRDQGNSRRQLANIALRSGSIPTIPAFEITWVTRFATRKSMTPPSPSSMNCTGKLPIGMAAITAWRAPTCRSAIIRTQSTNCRQPSPLIPPGPRNNAS